MQRGAAATQASNAKTQHRTLALVGAMLLGMARVGA